MGMSVPESLINWQTGVNDYRGSLLQAFLDQEALMLHCRDHSRRLLHAWRHERGVLAGSRDAALVSWPRSVDGLCKSGFRVLVRPFGGLAIPVDFGVLNLTLVLPGEPALDEAFNELAHWLADALTGYGHVNIGKVENSYCPGRFDLAIGGQKISGLAQRRIKGAVAVSAFVNLFPADYSRAALVRSLYEAEGVNATHRYPWLPSVHPDTVSDLFSLSQDTHFYSPHHFLTLLDSVHPLCQIGVDLEEIIAPHREEASHRLKTLRNMSEWAPFQ